MAGRPSESSGIEMPKSEAAERILAEVASGACQFVDLQFTDVTGALKSVVLPARQLEETLAYGHWFDGSALEGEARAMETDLLLRPDVSTWAILPWPGPGGQRTGRLLCDIQTPDEVPFPADPRAVLERLLQDAADLGYEYHASAEVEFFLFHAQSNERWPSLRGGSNNGIGGPRMSAGSPTDRGGYFDLSPESDAHFRDEVVQALASLGVHVEASHHEIGPGQHEIDLPLLPALQAADAIATCKYAVKTVARRRGLSATFMPKPLADVAGSGLHLAQVLYRRADDGASREVIGERGTQGAGARRVNAFADPLDEHGLSEVGRSFVAGQLTHARSMCAVLAPSVNSYKRLGRGFDAPSSITWGHTNPLAALRVPRPPSRRALAFGAGLQQEGAVTAMGELPRSPFGRSATRQNPSAAESVHVELRCSDPSCNPYLALAVALAAGLDGIRQGAQPPPPSDAAGTGLGGLYDEAQSEVLPASLGEALQELEWDPVVRDALGAPVYERLLVAREHEWQQYRRQVSAWEIDRYFDTA